MWLDYCDKHVNKQNTVLLSLCSFVVYYSSFIFIFNSMIYIVLNDRKISGLWNEKVCKRNRNTLFQSTVMLYSVQPEENHKRSQDCWSLRTRFETWTSRMHNSSATYFIAMTAALQCNTTTKPHTNKCWIFVWKVI